MDYITDYMMASESSVEDLVERVKELMKSGWRPQGGVCVYHLIGSPIAFYQAMSFVKERKLR